jgi:hypothetical protein
MPVTMAAWLGSTGCGGWRIAAICALANPIAAALVARAAALARSRRHNSQPAHALGTASAIPSQNGGSRLSAK